MKKNLDIILLGKPTCKPCNTAKKILKDGGVKYSYFDTTTKEGNDIINKYNLEVQGVPFLYEASTGYVIRGYSPRLYKKLIDWRNMHNE